MRSIDDVKIIHFQVRGDDRGSLIAIEENKDIPFDIKRVFYIFGSDKDVVRGQHANEQSEFVLVNVSGSSKVRVVDSKGNAKVFLLDKPSKALFIPTMLWKEMYDFSSDSVLLVITNTIYDPKEYVRDYKTFIKKEGKKERNSI